MDDPQTPSTRCTTGAPATPDRGPRRARRAGRWARARALLAGGLVLGVGGTVTLAAWTDTEWVWGGADGGGNVQTATFAIEQNVWNGTSGAAQWRDGADRSSAGQLDFTVDAARLVPGRTVYAPMQLRTKAGSEAGCVQLDGAALAAGSPAGAQVLYDALRYTVVTGVGKAACTAGTFTLPSSLSARQVVDAPLTTAGTQRVPLAADGPSGSGGAVDLCFAITLPATADNTTQGKSAQLFWKYDATLA
ncbi:SipW-dependent-type signal peptide-containing protein [Kineococcus aurantiacus]|uniref:Putative ribosomally synthesized peptide with SipW-like signal peptide n=1 Tax=Kineococcus aurantiacus TaxID=37633 RepID=A0A7Y9J1D9_9ACTN|nr:SipW-dependent-type signal peptide-containing protein [Kineococcus aurantiacus]NYD23047.1 putative ribosomally synthesized peptide with SipW-like signal peptide [Kineococcus aurantiacus]